MANQRVFHQLVVRLFLMAAVPAAVTGWLFGPIPGAAVGVVLITVELLRVRRAVLAGMPAELTFVPARPADYPWLDAEGFKFELEALAALGFHPVGDYTITYPGAPQAFARALLNAQYRVYAEVSQVKQEGVILPAATTLQSVLSDGWTVQTSGREVMPVSMAFMRSPRAVWRAHPEAEPADLLEDHLELRHRMLVDLGLELEGEGTLEGYFAVQQLGHETRVEAVRHTNILRGILRGLRCERTGGTEWLGKYRSA